MMFKRVGFIFLAVLLISAALTGCGTEEGTPGGGNEVVIGFSGPLSGVAAEYGQDGLNGVDMALKEINEAGGITIDGQTYTFRVEAMDDMTDPTMAVTNTRRFRDVYNTPAIFNPVYTAIAPMLGINREEGNEFLMMAYTSTPGELLLDNDLVVWIPPPFTVYVQGMSTKAMEEGWKKGAMVVTMGAYGDAWRGAFKATWEAMGGEITVDLPANYYTETDFSTQLASAIATKPDFMLVGGPSGPTALVIEQARDLGFTGGFILIDQAKLDYCEKLLGGLEMLEGGIGVIPPPHAPYPYMPGFNQRYLQQYEGKMVLTTWECALHYTATKALVKAMEIAGSVDDPYAIRAAFPEVFPLLGADYPAEYHGITDKGRMKLLASISMVKDGEYGPATPILWWPQTQAEFDAAMEAITADPNAVPIWIKWP